ncbi:MAG: chemotaxis protein CheW [Pseudomonadota bacterium]|nr:MAG: chemotaxis protein CheW [Pseudomonadota bacterium]
MTDAAERRPEQQAGRQVLTFRLGEEDFGVDILRVKEIRGWSPVTRIPQARPHVLGVVNLRGTIVPVIDLRVRFGLPRAEFTPLTVVIVISFDMAGGPKECGLVVDGVSDVCEIAPDALRPAPALAGQVDAECIHGLVSIDERMAVLLDVGELAARELGAAADAA